MLTDASERLAEIRQRAEGVSAAIEKEAGSEAGALDQMMEQEQEQEQENEQVQIYRVAGGDM